MRTSIVISSLSAMLVGTAVLAQAPLSEIDAHIATAKAAAGQEYRGTFVNLCLPSAPRGGGAGRGGAAAAARRRRAPNAGPRQLVCAAVQSVRQFLLAGHAPAFVVGASDQRRHHHHRYELRVGDTAGDHRRDDKAGLESERHQVRDHQPRARRSRSGRRRAAGALQRASRDGCARLGRDDQAARRLLRAGYRSGTSRSGRRAGSSLWAIPPWRSSLLRATLQERCPMSSR